MDNSMVYFVKLKSDIEAPSYVSQERRFSKWYPQSFE